VIPEPFRSIVRDCLRHNPNQRCSIKDIEARLQPPARSVAAVESPAADRGGRSRFVTLAGTLALILAAIGLAYSCGRHRNVPTIATQETVASAPATPPAASGPTQPATSKSDSADSTVASPPSSTRETVPNLPAASAPKSSSTQGDAVRRITPSVPAGARRTITGTVRINVKVDVDASGKVTHAKLASPEHSKYFASLALKASQQWEFLPPVVDGQATTSAWMLRYSFTRSSTNVVPEQTRH
jgi:TonB family protein